MTVTTRAIVISALKYNDKGLIVKCLTESDGLKSYFVRDAFSKNRSNQKIAYFQPLNILEIEASHKNKGTLEYFKEVKLAAPYQTINRDIVKTTIAIFIAEMLHNSIREEQKDQRLYSFLETALLWLDSHDEVVNFHLVLLLEITKFLGFYPNRSLLSYSFFEMTDGVFVPFETLTCLSEKETMLLRQLMALKLDSGIKSFNVGERQALLKILLDYYSLHLDGFRKPNSVEVLKEVFS